MKLNNNSSRKKNGLREEEESTNELGREQGRRACSPDEIIKMEPIPQGYYTPLKESNATAFQTPSMFRIEIHPGRDKEEDGWRESGMKDQPDCTYGRKLALKSGIRRAGRKGRKTVKRKYNQGPDVKKG